MFWCIVATYFSGCAVLLGLVPLSNNNELFVLMSSGYHGQYHSSQSHPIHCCHTCILVCNVLINVMSSALILYYHFLMPNLHCRYIIVIHIHVLLHIIVRYYMVCIIVTCLGECSANSTVVGNTDCQVKPPSQRQTGRPCGPTPHRSGVGRNPLRPDKRG